MDIPNVECVGISRIEATAGERYVRRFVFAAEEGTVTVEAFARQPERLLLPEEVATMPAADIPTLVECRS